MGDVKIFCCNQDSPLAKGISKHVRLPLGKIDITRFSDGEKRIQFLENIRESDVFLIQATNQPDENLMKLLIMIDAAKRASASRITAVIPYYGYGRQDRKDRPRVAIVSKLVAKLIESAGAHRILAMDLHFNQLVGFFEILVDHIYARPVLIPELEELAGKNLRVIAPDGGAAERARSYAKRLGASVVHIDKRRDADGKPEVKAIVGEIGPDDTALICDDMIDSGGTLIATVEGLQKKAGVSKFYVVATHAVLSGSAIQKIDNSPISRVYITDTIDQDEQKFNQIQRSGKFKVVSTASLFGEAIKIYIEGGSISTLFED